MEISKGMLINYVSYITEGWMADNDEEKPVSFADYNEVIMKIKQSLILHGDLEPFRLGIEYYLSHTEIDLEDVFVINYPWDDEEIRKLFDYIREAIYFDVSELDYTKIKEVKITNTSKFDWWDSRIKLQPKNYQESWNKRKNALI